MRKHHRNDDNSKRQQPVQQQRAQARLALPGSARKERNGKLPPGGNRSDEGPDKA